MDARNSNSSPPTNGRTGKAEGVLHRPCTGYRGLIRWQMARYGDAVDELRLSLSVLRKRSVTRAEAEPIFCKEHCAEQSRKWREEYCGNLCEHRFDCPLADLYHSAA